MDDRKYEYDYHIVTGSDGGKELIDKLKEGWDIMSNTCGTYCVHYVLIRELA